MRAVADGGRCEHAAVKEVKMIYEIIYATGHLIIGCVVMAKVCHHLGLF